MSKTFEEIKAEREKAKKSSTTKKSFDEIKKEYTNSKVNSDYVKSFFDDSQSYLSGVEKSSNELSYGNAFDTYKYYKDSSYDLDERANTIKTYYEQNKGNMSQEDYDNMMSYLYEFNRSKNNTIKYFKGNADYISQFKTEDEYNSAVKSLEDYNKALTLDLDAASAEIDQLRSLSNDVANAENNKNKSTLGEITAGYIRAGMDENTAKKRAEEDYAKIQQQNAPYDEQISGYLDGTGYGNSTDLNIAINQKNAYYNQAKRLQESKSLEAEALGSSDYNLYSSQGKALASEKEWVLGKYKNYIGFLRDNPDYIESMEASSRTNFFMDNTVKNDLEYKAAKYMTDEEYGIYAYYLGKGDTESAQRYLDSIEETLNTRQATKMFGDMEGNILEEIAFGIAAGTDQFTSGMANLFSNEEYIPYTGFQTASGMVREDLADKGMDVLGSSVGQATYDLVTTTSNMMPSILTSTMIGMLNPAAGEVVGATLMGASAAGNAYQEMVNLGYSREQARVYSTITGTLEAGLQYALGGIGKLGGKFTDFGIEKMTGIIQQMAMGINNAAVQGAVLFGADLLAFGAEMFDEGLEEFLQDILNPYVKAIATGEYVDIPEDYMQQALYSGLLGALSAGVLNGAGKINGRVSDLVSANTAIKNGKVSDVLNVANTFDASTIANQLAQKLAGKEKVGAWELSTLIGEMNANLGEQTVADIKNELIRRGITETDAETITKWLSKAVDGAAFTKAQRKALDKNEVISDVYRKVIIDKNSTINQRMTALSSVNRIGDTYGSEIDRNASRDAIALRGAIKITNQADAQAKAMRKFGVGNNSAVENLINNAVDKSKVSTTGKTTDTTTGKAVKIKSIASSVPLSKGSELKFNTSNGVVDEKNIKYKSSKEAYIYSTIKELGADANTGNYIIHALNASDMNSTVFVNEAALAYNYGLTGQETMLKTLSIPEEVKDELYKAGRKGSKNISSSKMAEARKRTAIAKKKSDGANLAESIAKKLNQKNKGGLNANQLATIEGANTLARISNLDITVFESERIYNPDGTYKVFVEIDGKRFEASANGWYSVGTNKIYIDINAGGHFQGIGLLTLGHETGHFIRDWNAEGFRTMADVIVAEINRQAEESPKKPTFEEMLSNKLRLYEKLRKNEHPDYVKLTDSELHDAAYEDVICDSLGSLMKDVETFSQITKEIEAKDKNLFDKIKDFINKWIEKLTVAISQFTGKTEDASGRAIENATIEFRDHLRELYAKAFAEADKNLGNAMGRFTSTQEETYLETKNPLYHERFTEDHFNLIDKYYDDSSAEIDKDVLVARYQKVIDIWKELGGEINSQFLKDWNNQEYQDRAFTVFKAQSGYKYNVELSSMCKKGIPLFEAIDTIVKKEVMKQLNTKTLGKAEKEILYDILKTKGFDIPCAICYVEQARQREGAIIDAFVDGKIDKDNKGNVTKIKLGWNEVIDKVEEKMSELGVEYAFENVSRDIATEVYNPKNFTMDEKTQAAYYEALRQLCNEEIKRYNKENPTKKKSLIKSTSPTDVNAVLKGSLNSNFKIFKVLFNNPDSRFKFDNDLLYSSMTTRNLAKSHPELYSLFNSQGGTAGYKSKQGTVAYMGDFLKKKWTSEQTRKEGGVRNQSNSDFMMYTLLDQVQMYVDLSAKGYYLHAYTKVLAELKLFGLSGSKINASLIPAVHEYKNADGSVDVEKTRLNAGLDVNGNPIYDDIEGINHKEAFMILSDPEYSKNCSGICIGYSDAHIMALLDDPKVQEIIGFHDKTNDPDKRYRGARYAKNYNGLNEAVKVKADGTTETVHIGFNQFVIKAEKILGETNDGVPEMATKLYKEYCEKKGLIPAYHILVEYNGQQMYMDEHPNYYKLLGDFGLKNSEGHYAPHKKVQFNMPDFIPYLDKDGNKKYEPTKDYIKRELAKELKVRDDISAALADDSETGIIPQFVSKTNEMYGKKKNSDRAYFATDEFTELADENKLIAALQDTIKAANGSFNAKYFNALYRSNPEYEYIDRIQSGDKNAEKELKELVSRINTVDILNDLRWFVAMGHDNIVSNAKIVKYSTKHTKGLKKFREIIDARIMDLIYSGGVRLSFKENQELTVKEVRDLFNKLNSNADIEYLANKVFDTAEGLDLAIIVTDKGQNKTASYKVEENGHYRGNESLYTGRSGLVVYRTTYLNGTYASDQAKANTLVHELIHAVTMYAIHNVDTFNGRYGGNKFKKIVTIFDDIYYRLKHMPNQNPDFAKMYGMKVEMAEYVAELLNPKFQEAMLQSKTKWADDYIDILGAEASLYGMDTSKTIYENSLALLDCFISGFDEQEYFEYTKRRHYNPKTETIKYSEREIIGVSGKNYGIGVYLDAPAFDGKSSDEGKEFLHKFVKKIAGKKITLHSDNGDEITVKIATQTKFKNENGRERPAYNDLQTRNDDFPAKQESVYLAKELADTASSAGFSKATHSHSWIDNDGKNDWEKFTTYVVDRNNNIQVVELDVATNTDGTRMLYDIEPKKIVEQAVTSATSPLDGSISSHDSTVNKNSERNLTIYVHDGHMKSGKTVNFIDLILDGKKLGETREHKQLTRKQWVGLAKDGYVYGRVRLGEPIEITKSSPEYKDAYIAGTDYDIKPGVPKYYYPILEKEDFRDNPRPVEKNGNYGQYKYSNRQTKESAEFTDQALFGTLYSSGGMMETGLVYKMLSQEFGVEIDEKVAAIHELNHKAKVYAGELEGNALTFDIKSHAKGLLYVHFSPVCHNFSKAKHQRTEHPDDIASAKKVVENVRDTMLPLYTVENAPDYATSKSAKIIVDGLAKLGYKLRPMIYNAADYGAATTRERYILVAVREDLNLPEVPAKQPRTNTMDKATRRFWAGLENAKARNGEALAPSYKSAFLNTKKLQKYINADGTVTTDKAILLLQTTSGHEVTYSLEGETVPTLTTKCGEARLILPGKNIPLDKPNDNIKRPTPQMMGAIQGMPDGYDYGDSSDRAFTVIGNGIPADLARAVMGGALESVYRQTHDGKKLYSERGNGYDGYSMSNNAREAYSNNEKPLSRWSKADIISAIREIDEGKADLLSKVNLKTLKGIALRKTSWHHTSEYYNKTDFYSVDEESVKALTEKEIKSLATQKETMAMGREYRGDFTYLEWGGTRNHPKAQRIELKDVNIEERGSFYIVTDDSGKVLVKKKIGSNGTSATNYETIAKIDEAKRNEYQTIKENSSPEALELYDDMMRNGYSKSMSGNIYRAGRKPSSFDVAMGLENFFEKGERRLTLNDASGYDIEVWNGTDWEKAKETKKYSERGNLGYHAGDLGKAESLAQQGYGRGTGHFGTGTYFVGSPEKIKGYNKRNGVEAPVETVDFSKYNLYKVRNDKDGYRLHDFLRGVDGFYNLDKDAIRTEREWERRKDDLEYAISEEDISVEDAIAEAKKLFGRYNFANEFQRRAEAPEGKGIGIATDGSLILWDDKTSHDEDIPDNELSKYADIYDVIWELISENRYAPRTVSRIEEWDHDLAINATALFIKTKDEILNVIDEVRDEIENAKYSYDESKVADSAATRFMKKLGYEGVDVRGTGLDNTTYGSVIYDLKGEDLARKKEIGTARYSERNTSTDPRTLLSNALLETAQNDVERKYIADYQANIEKISADQQRLMEVKAEIKELSFGTGKKDAQRLKTLNEEATKLANRINIYDKKLLKLESTKPLQDVVEREKVKARKRAEQKSREALDNYRSRGQNTKVRTKIKKLIGELKSADFNPRVNNYIPADFMTPVNEILSAINLDSGRSEKLSAKLAELKVKYDAMASDPKYAVNYDQTVSAMVQTLIEKVGDTSIYNMNTEQLEATYSTLKAITHMIKTAHKIRNIESEKLSYEISAEMNQETQQVRRSGDGLVDRYIWTSLRPETAFERFAGFKKDSMWSKVYRMLDNGQLKKMQIDMEANAIFKDIFEDEEYVKSLSDTKHLVDIGLKDDKGNTVMITKGMALAIYRALMNEDNTRHMMVGGITVPNIKKYYQGSDSAYGVGRIVVHGIASNGLSENTRKLADAKSRLKFEMSDEDTSNPEMVESIKKEIADLTAERQAIIESGEALMNQYRDNIRSLITEKDIAFLNATAEFFDVYSKRVLNETTMELYGFEKAQVENYLPIHTDDDFRQATFESITKDMNLENVGFMKDRVSASNPVYLEDLAEIINSQINKVSTYAGMTIPIKDFGKIYGKTDAGYASSLQNSIDSKFGNPGKKYIENLLSDLVGSRRTKTTFLDRSRGYMAGATLSINPRVALAQAASLPTAAAEIGWKPVTKASGMMLKSHDLDLIAKYTPLLYNRSKGANIEAADIKQMSQPKNQVMRKLNWLMGWIEAIDKKTVGTLWYASQYYVQDNFKNLEEGSEEYYTKVAEVFNRVVEKTQPNYTTMQRPDILRNPNAVVKQLTMFMTQRLQNVNIVYEAASTFAKYNADKKLGINGVTDADVKEAKGRLTNAIASQLVASATIVGIKALVDALMHNMNAYRDDDDKELTAGSISLTLLENMLETIMSNMLGGSELFKVLDSCITGSRYYGISLNGVETYFDAISDFVSLVQNPSLDKCNKLAKSVCTFLGIPLSNVEKIGYGIYYHAVDIANGNFGTFEAGVDRSNKQDVSRAYKAYKKGDTKKVKEVIAGIRQEYLDKGKTEKEANTQIRSAITSYVKADFLEAYGKGDNAKMTEIRKFMQSTGVYDDVVGTTQTWIKNSKK